MTATFAIECEALGRVYGGRGVLGRGRETVALESIDLQVPAGMVFGLLGPNGAGKTTTVRILSTLLSPTSGAASVLGYDVERQTREVREHIGLILGGERGLYYRLTGKENLEYFAALNAMRPDVTERRVTESLAMVGLDEWPNMKVEEYSRGMKQRLHIARGLLADPTVIFMDEPTIGLYPVAAQDVRGFIPDLKSRGKTILLTTHYMSEADQLCDYLALINHGRIIALGTPEDIKGRFSGIRIMEITLRQARSGLAEEIRGLDGVRRVEEGVDGALPRLTVHIPFDGSRDAVLAKLGDGLIDHQTERDPTLEEAYLTLLRD
jgi:ABC-2 type transport system ATP-binding protein